MGSATLPGMTPERAAALINYLAGQSGEARLANRRKPWRAERKPFTAEQVQAGLELFRGDAKLEAGRASCLCHDVSGVG
ncbi:MAG: hypothetical protein R2748_21995 [Bryobacterales bacterium]